MEACSRDGEGGRRAAAGAGLQIQWLSECVITEAPRVCLAGLGTPGASLSFLRSQLQLSMEATPGVQVGDRKSVV